MSFSDVGQRDPSVVGSSRYPRNPLDHYLTPERAIRSLLSVIEDDLPSYLVWEPFCGNGAFSNLLAPHARNIVSTDIRAYDGFDPDGLLDFFEIDTVPIGQRIDVNSETQEKTFTFAPDPLLHSEDPKSKYTLADVANLKGFLPDAIISNPPYGRDAERAARHAIALMEQTKGLVIFLCRHEWDASKRRMDLFDHPTFSMKIVLRHRPRWIEGSEGAPRFPYAYYVWDWQKALQAPHTPASIVYAA